MPEMHFEVRWPDGKAIRCYSPSLVIKDWFAPGERYPVSEFLQRAREAYRIADERVRARWGWGCAHAAGQLAQLEQEAERFAPDALVQVERFEE